MLNLKFVDKFDSRCEQHDRIGEQEDVLNIHCLKITLQGRLCRDCMDESYILTFSQAEGSQEFEIKAGEAIKDCIEWFSANQLELCRVTTNGFYGRYSTLFGHIQSAVLSLLEKGSE